jgi:hypothetical protein
MDEMNDFEVTEFEEPITIKCNVEGRNLMAEISCEYHDPTEHFFLIEFSNDVQIVAGPSSVEPGSWWVHDLEYLPYLNSVKKSIADFIAVSESFWYKFEIKDGSQKLLVWAAQSEENKNEFSIHYEGDYQFHLEKTSSGWTSWTIRENEPNPIIEHIVKEVSKYLNEKI